MGNGLPCLKHTAGVLSWDAHSLCMMSGISLAWHESQKFLADSYMVVRGRHVTALPTRGDANRAKEQARWTAPDKQDARGTQAFRSAPESLSSCDLSQTCEHVCSISLLCLAMQQ